MTAVFLLAVTLLRQDPPQQVVEVQVQGADRVAVQAVIPLPHLDSRGRAAAVLLAHSLQEDNGHFGKSDMRALCAPGGEPRAWVMPDHIGISLTVLPQDLAMGVRMLAGILSEPRLSVEKLKAFSQDEQTRTVSTWRRALDVAPRNWKMVLPEDVRDLHLAMCRPERLTVAVAGALTPGAATAVWVEAISNWRLPRPPRLRSGIGGSPWQAASGPSIIELRAPEWPADGADFPAKLLALIALGSGKGSSLFRIAREERGWSYRQEGVLCATPAGVQPRLMMAVADAGEEEQRLKLAEDLRGALLVEVDKWNEATLGRAVGYGSLIVHGGADMSPLYLWPWLISGSPQSRAFLAAYWKSKSGTAWNPDLLASAFESVSLETLRTTAKEILTEAIAVPN